MPYKIGVFGSAIKGSQDLTVIAKKLGQILAKHKVTVITGASGGIPFIVAKEAFKNGANIWGYSPALDLISQKKNMPTCDPSIFAKLIFTPKEFEFSNNLFVCQKYRNVISTANCDAGIILSGRWGTMNEFTNLFDMNKIIGVLTGTGGIAGELPRLCEKIKKGDRGKVIFNDDPEELVEMMIKEIKKKYVL